MTHFHEGALPNPDDPSFSIDDYLWMMDGEMDDLDDYLGDASHAQACEAVLTSIRKYADDLPLPDGIEELPKEEFIDPTTALYPDDVRRTIGRAHRIVDALVILGFQSPTTYATELVSCLGSIVIDLEDRKEIEAWTSVVKEVFAPHVAVDDVIGTDPKVVLLQAVAGTEADIAHNQEKEVWKAFFQVTALPLLQEFLSETGKQFHDQSESLEKHIIWYCSELSCSKEAPAGLVKMIRHFIDSDADQMGIRDLITDEYLARLYRDAFLAIKIDLDDEDDES